VDSKIDQSGKNMAMLRRQSTRLITSSGQEASKDAKKII